MPKTSFHHSELWPASRQKRPRKPDNELWLSTACHRTHRHLFEYIQETIKKSRPLSTTTPNILSIPTNPPISPGQPPEKFTRTELLRGNLGEANLSLCRHFRARLLET